MAANNKTRNRRDVTCLILKLNESVRFNIFLAFLFILCPSCNSTYNYDYTAQYKNLNDYNSPL